MTSTIRPSRSTTATDEIPTHNPNPMMGYPVGSYSTGMAFEQSRLLTEAPLRQALDRLDPQTRAVCRYHLGFASADGSRGGGGGKGIRAALCLLSGQASGAETGSAIPAAVACELVHNFSLLHDDVMDGDVERRHRPTAWTQFSRPAAILAGDAMLALAGEVLAEAPTPTAAWAVRCLMATTRRLVAGQAADLAFETRDDVGLDECLRMAADKTGALLSCSASLGAVLLDAPAELALGLADFGAHLGLAFQLIDDLLGIWGSSAQTGKPVGSDLRARKKSLPVVAAWQSHSTAGAALRDIYADPEPLTDDDISEAADLVERAGGRRWTQQRADQETTLALAVLDDLALPATVHGELITLTEMLSGRER